MTTKRVFSDFKNPYQQLSSTEEFIQRCKIMYSGRPNDINAPNRSKDGGLEQSTIMTFISLLSDIAVRCQSLEVYIKDVQTQVSNLQKTVEDLRIPGETTKLIPDDAIHKSPPSEEEESEETSPRESESDVTDIAAAVTITNVKYARSKKVSGDTNDIKERLQTLQWKTFDLQRQNELLRRMLEIQCTVNENAAKVAAEKQKDQTSTEDTTQTIQQADSTSNNNSASSDMEATAATPMSTQQYHQQDYVPSGAGSGATSTTTADPSPGVSDQTGEEKSPEHEEYVPLSAEEMLAQSFADPKVPWPSNDGTENTGEVSESQEPNIQYAHVYTPGTKTEMWHTNNAPPRKITSAQSKKVSFGPPCPAPAGWNPMVYGKSTLGDVYRWERKGQLQENPNVFTAN